MNNSGIVLFAKMPGKTSFSSLYTIKKALKTNKVGHTGTLDSFACGLLVVCTGCLTRLASKITAFDKTYEAVVKFGQETDTLDYTGNIIKNTDLPVFDELEKSLSNFLGTFLQIPPSFSAIHLNGKRASDLARNGKNVEIPARSVRVYSSKILEVQTEFGDVFLPESFANLKKTKILYARILFSVSKGTYIRSLARDIGNFCNSSAHLVGLLRTKVGNFTLDNAVGKEFLKDFNLKSVVENLCASEVVDVDAQVKSAVEQELRKQVLEKLVSMDEKLACSCGFKSITLLENWEFSFYNGKPLKFAFFKDIENVEDFEKKIDSTSDYAQISVFTEKGVFAGIINYNLKKLSYGYVVPRG